MGQSNPASASTALEERFAALEEALKEASARLAAAQELAEKIQRSTAKAEQGDQPLPSSGS